jgi:hypothetical protein
VDDLEVPDWQAERLFHFVRLLKAHGDLTPLTADGGFAKVDKILQGWAKRLPAAQRRDDPWRLWLGRGRPDAQAEFVDIWDKVRYLPGAGPLDNADFEARRAPLKLSAEKLKKRCYAGEYIHFVSLAGYLQVVVGPQPIYLPGQAVAELIGVEERTVRRYVAWAVQDDYLRQVQAAVRQKRATRYVFNVEAFDCLKERAAPGVAQMWENHE